MSMDGQGTRQRRKIAENFNRLRRAHHRHRQTDGTAITYSEREREFTFAKNDRQNAGDFDGDLFTRNFRPKSVYFLADVNLRSRLLYAIGRPSVCCLSSVCDDGAPFSAG